MEIMGCANMNFLRQGFQKLSLDRQTDRPKLYTTPLCRWSVIIMIINTEDSVYWTVTKTESFWDFIWWL